MKKDKKDRIWSLIAIKECERENTNYIGNNYSKLTENILVEI
jgi:hypothetical protein